MPTTPVLKARGLNLSPNQLTVEEGSLTQAENIIIRRDDVIEPRRGFKLYGETFGTATDILKQTFVYRERLLRHYNQVLQFQNGINNDGEVNFDNFSGSYSEAETGIRMKSIESNGNFYFTTSDGIKKISAASGSQLSTSSGYITSAGGIKALDIQARLNIELGGQTGFLTQDGAVAYRALWSTFDANNNLIQGTPSQRVEIYNSLETLLIKDFNRLLHTLDIINQSGSLITDGNYVSTLGLTITDSAADVRTNAIALTSKLDNDIVITEDAVDTVTVQRITTTTAEIVFDTDVSDRIAIGDVLDCSGFTSTDFNSRTFTVTSVLTTTVGVTIASGGNFTGTDGSPTADTGGSVQRIKYVSITQPGIPSTPATNDNLVDIQDYISNIIVELQSELTGIISQSLSDTYIIPLDITTTATTLIDITIPENVTENDFLQLYRSPVVEATGTTVLTDLIPNDEMQLAVEVYPSAAEISAGIMTISDVTPDIFLGSYLYTNENTGDGGGIAQANDLPPFAKDINKFKNSVFYANTRTRHRKLLSLLGVENILTDYNNGLNSKTFTSSDVNATTNIITITNHGFIDGQSIRFSNATATNLPGGINQGQIYYILNSDTNTFQITTERDSITPVDITSGGTGTHTVVNILPTLTVLSEDSEEVYSFIKGIKQVTQVVTVADSSDSLNGKYFYINSANNLNEYLIYGQSIGEADSNPGILGKTAIPYYFNTNDADTVIAQILADTINGLLPHDFTATVSTNTVTITNSEFGYTDNASDVDTGFTITTPTSGAGESTTNNEILLSNEESPAIAVDETAKSIVRVINANNDDIINAFYLSTANTVPGRMFFESRELNETPFYLLSNTITVGESFSPDISPQYQIKSISVANPTVITTLSAHGLTTGDTVIINSSNSTPSVNGVREVIVTSSTSFTIDVNVTVAGNFGSFSTTDWVETSENEIKPNRIYYSKTSQPEAVPLTNYFEVGSEEKQILRIAPLRDSLFVFKEDGIYRISGEVIPFTLSLFDESSKLIAPDSLALSDNLIYYWSEQGIVTVSESGVSSPISRPIDTAILKLATSQYQNFRTATFGIGYDSDNAYYVWTVQNIDDEVATICYRFSTLTSTWTTFDKTNTCGIISDVDDKMYLGAGDTNQLEQERKDFTRYDYADREIEIILNQGGYISDSSRLKFDNLISNFEIGDVLVQDQTLTTFIFNGLLNKLDIDPGVNDNDYFDTLEATAGINMKNRLLDLAAKLDADTGVNDTDYESTIESKSGTITNIDIGSPIVITNVGHELFTGRLITIVGSDSVPSIDGNYEVTVIDANTFSITGVTVTTAGTTGTWSTIEPDFTDLMACYNKVIEKLNSDIGVSFANYLLIENTTPQETIIVDIDTTNSYIYVQDALNFVVGSMTLYKAITSTFTYCPNSGGDPYSFKHFRQATMMFDSKAFTNASLSFASDLLPEYVEIPFDGDGSGIFGSAAFGSGFFGGASNAEPFRTLIPKTKQRCRYISTRFEHRVAREAYAVNGMTLTFEPYSLPDRAYRR